MKIYSLACRVGVCVCAATSKCSLHECRQQTTQLKSTSFDFKPTTTHLMANIGHHNHRWFAHKLFEFSAFFFRGFYFQLSKLAKQWTIFSVDCFSCFTWIFCVCVVLLLYYSVRFAHESQTHRYNLQFICNELNWSLSIVCRFQFICNYPFGFISSFLIFSFLMFKSHLELLELYWMYFERTHNKSNVFSVFMSLVYYIRCARYAFE